MEDNLQPSAERAEQAEIRRSKQELEITRQERDILKSHSSVLVGGVVKRYQFIESHRQMYPVQRMCAVLGVGLSGFYE